MTADSCSATADRIVRIAEAVTGDDLAHAAALFREYGNSLPGKAHISLWHQGFENELQTLPGRYARPAGCILLAYAEDRPVGCVAIREIPPTPSDTGRVCEMKRMYVKPSERGKKIGRLLVERLIAEAKQIGYTAMKLDTEPDFDAAIGLYKAFGFREIERYNDDPVACTVYFGLSLTV